MKHQPISILVLSLLLIPAFAFSQAKKKKDIYEFKTIYEVKTTPVKNQAKTGASWSFATTSFVETELIRMGKGEHILSPMYNVRYAYPQKAENYIRYAGLTNFDEGGQAHDAMKMIREYGLIPEEIYKGMKIKEEEHNHGEMHAVLKAIIDAVNRNRGGKITSRWKEAFESTLNIYLGVPPKEFNYQGIKYTPKSFCESFGFNPDDYVELTSFSHHTDYAQFNLEIPDNWSKNKYYNIPMNDMIHLIDSALSRGYSVVWAGDISEKTFDKKKCIAIIPSTEETSDEDSKKEDDDSDHPAKEKFITQEMRQESFDNRTTSYDHMMHITGLAKDQNGYKFYYAKNSWGTKEKKYGGYWYMSERYFRLKTIAILVHKNAMPRGIKAKLGLLG